METSAPVQIPPEQQITITLQAQHWQVIMNALQEMPFRMANPVIQVLTQQFSVSLSEKQQFNPTSNGSAEYEIPEAGR